MVFEIEVPSIYTADLESLREYQKHFASESEWLLNCIGEPHVCRLRVEVSGEKDSSVEEVWGSIRSARLAAPSRGYGDGSHLTEEQLAKHGWRLMPDDG